MSAGVELFWVLPKKSTPVSLVVVTLVVMNDGYTLDEGLLNLLPLLAMLSKVRDSGHGAALFHATLTDALVAWVVAAMENTGLNSVVFGGGCFLNRLLSANLATRLEVMGVCVYQACQAPPNDGGLSLGQAWVAMQTGFTVED
jgi:hydrogenase maturation protein HypF